MKKQLLIFPSIIFFFILLVFFYLLIIDRDPTELPSVLIEKKVPRFEAETLMDDKKFISMEEFGNKTVIVNFFATWCKPCREEHPYIKRLSNIQGIKIIGINYKDNKKSVINWLNKLGNPYSNIPIDKDGRIAIEWGVYGIPETFVINSNGIIKYKHIGPITEKVYKKINLLIKKIE